MNTTESFVENGVDKPPTYDCRATTPNPTSAKINQGGFVIMENNNVLKNHSVMFAARDLCGACPHNSNDAVI